MKAFSGNSFVVALSITACIFLTGAARANAQDQSSFESPEAAVDALVVALEKNDVAALAAILGPDSEDILSSGDDVADAAGRAGFLADFKVKHALIAEGQDIRVLEVGANAWPLPVPLVRIDDRWVLDGAAGADEIVYRRIGRNELGAIAMSRGFVDAQIEYASLGRDGNPPGLFAMKLRSDPGLHNGLFWPNAEGEPPSPVGSAVAQAAAEGYRAITGKRMPYHGYYYRMLYAQGEGGEGGAMEYFVDGQLTQGAALLAWPAQYGVSGVMTFITSLDGVVFQQDLGVDTAETVDAIQVFDPGSGAWIPVEAEIP
jgi:hypothetical protein